MRHETWMLGCGCKRTYPPLAVGSSDPACCPHHGKTHFDRLVLPLLPVIQPPYFEEPPPVRGMTKRTGEILVGFAFFLGFWSIVVLAALAAAGVLG